MAIKVGRSITSEDAIDTLAELFSMRGVPRCIRSNNGPEFIAKAIQGIGVLPCRSAFRSAGMWRSDFEPNRVQLFAVSDEPGPHAFTLVRFVCGESMRYCSDDGVRITI